MSDIMIVGGAGFVGSNISNYLIQHTKYSVCTVDNLTCMNYYHRLAPSLAAKSRHTFYLADISDENIMSKVLQIERPKTIIYTCFTDHQNDDLKNSSLFMRFDRALSVAGIKCDKLISIVKSPKPYGYTYAAAQDVSNVAANHWYVIKPCELFGPRQKTSAPIPSMVKALAEGGSNEWSAEASQWMYVREFFITLLNNFIDDNSVESGIYHIVSGQFASPNDLYTHLKCVSGGGGQCEWNPSVGEITEEDGIQNFIVPPMYDLREALEHTAIWYEHNKWAWS